jgi:hypothetical protein
MIELSDDDDDGNEVDISQLTVRHEREKLN